MIESHHNLLLSYKYLPQGFYPIHLCLLAPSFQVFLKSVYSLVHEIGKKITRSQSNKQDVSDFVDQKLLASDEVCSFGATDIEDLIQKGVFPSGVEIMPPNSQLQSDFISRTWVAFPEFPFTLGLKYPFTGIIAEFFARTGIFISKRCLLFGKPCIGFIF